MRFFERPNFHKRCAEHIVINNFAPHLVDLDPVDVVQRELRSLEPVAGGAGPLGVPISTVSERQDDDARRDQGAADQDAAGGPLTQDRPGVEHGERRRQAGQR